MSNARCGGYDTNIIPQSLTLPGRTQRINTSSKLLKKDFKNVHDRCSSNFITDYVFSSNQLPAWEPKKSNGKNIKSLERHSKFNQRSKYHNEDISAVAFVYHATHKLLLILKKFIL